MPANEARRAEMTQTGCPVVEAHMAERQRALTDQERCRTTTPGNRIPADVAHPTSNLRPYDCLHRTESFSHKGPRDLPAIALAILRFPNG